MQDKEREIPDNRDSMTRKLEEHARPYPVSRLAPPITLVDLAREIEAAERLVDTRLDTGLRVIAAQIENLRQQARELLLKAQGDQKLHRATCRFKKIPGQIYSLYRRPSGENYFSRLSPDDWSGHPPHEFLGSYRLESDFSWVRVDEPD
jgi:chromatin segregation and condensation protein Rec8/ScpA/Scc1 (kleisin family)